MLANLQLFGKLLVLIQMETEAFRSQLFSPILCRKPFSDFTADGISFFRGVLAMTFPFLINIQPEVAWILMFISFILDAFDGVVARFQKTNSDRGKFVDMLADQLTFMSLAFGFMVKWPFLVIPIVLSVFMISLLYVIVIVRKNERKPSDWIIHPRAQQTAYKCAFIVVVIGFEIGFLGLVLTQIGLYSLSIITIGAFLYHYINFILKR